MSPLGDLRAALEAASAGLRAAVDAGPGAPAVLERPKREGFGDYSTNEAMLLAPVLRQPPREIAERLGAALAERLGPALERYEVAGPGFLNLFLADEWYRGTLSAVLDAGAGYGGGGAAVAERVDVEFVSANPTGPMHVGHARNAAYGDALCRILEFHGHEVTREFYINDYGSQVTRLGESIRARARGEQVPEGGYQGEYVKELAAAIPDAATADIDEVAHAGIELVLTRTRASLRAFHVADFDVWFSERSLHEGDPSAVRQTLDALVEQGHAYRSEGALWLRTSAFGDDKDRVLVRTDGEHTYFASDIPYHQHKRARGYDRLIDVLGADHHGYVGRMKAYFVALGGDPEQLELITMQLVHLVEGGARAQMSKRAGEFVTLDDLVAEIGVDATRWFLLARSHDTPIDLDLELARSQSSENPVYYVQYAHARVASLLAKAGPERVAEALAETTTAPVALGAAERALIKRLLALPDEVWLAAIRRAPHRLTTYALELAQDFTHFYRDCRVVGAEPAELESFRLALSVAARRAIARALDLLGITAPESM